MILKAIAVFIANTKPRKTVAIQARFRTIALEAVCAYVKQWKTNSTTAFVTLRAVFVGPASREAEAINTDLTILAGLVACTVFAAISIHTFKAGFAINFRLASRKTEASDTNITRLAWVSTTIAIREIEQTIAVNTDIPFVAVFVGFTREEAWKVVNTEAIDADISFFTFGVISTARIRAETIKTFLTFRAVFIIVTGPESTKAIYAGESIGAVFVCITP